jgi:hypothetical protein
MNGGIPSYLEQMIAKWNGEEEAAILDDVTLKLGSKFKHNCIFLEGQMVSHKTQYCFSANLPSKTCILSQTKTNEKSQKWPPARG